MGDPVTMIQWFKDHAVPVENVGTMSPEALEDKFTVGILANVEKPIYTQEYEKIRGKAKQSHKQSE